MNYMEERGEDPNFRLQWVTEELIDRGRRIQKLWTNQRGRGDHLGGIVETTNSVQHGWLVNFKEIFHGVGRDRQREGSSTD